MVCGAAVCLGAITAQAADTEAHAKARQALRQKMQELQTQPQVQAAQPAPAYTSTQADSDAIARARAALRQKLSEPVVPEPAPIVAPAPATAVPAMSPITTPAPVEPDAIARARLAVRQKLEELAAQEPTPAPEPVAAVAQPATTKIKPAPAPAAPAGRAEAERQALKATDTFRPMEAPPSALPASKEARLADLLQRYKADKITPQEYHTQRAAILAEP